MCCPGAEIPGRFFTEVREEKTWHPKNGWDWITGKNHTNPPLSPPRDVMRGEVALALSIDITFSIFDMLDL